MPATGKVKRWGKRMAIVIPSRFAKSRKIEVGTVIDLEGIRVIKPRPRRYKLSELLREFKPQHRHEEWNVGRPVGKEIW
jgi:antitoxin component of MazEF toxin-antitoxin module